MNDPNAPTERQARALALWRAGRTFSQIARELGIERGNACKLVDTAVLKEKRREKLESRRAHARAEEV